MIPMDSTMKHFVCWSAIVALFCLPVLSFGAQEEKVIISYSSRDFSVLPAHVALTKGFFKEEGLDPVMVQMRPPVAGPALKQPQQGQRNTHNRETTSRVGSRIVVDLLLESSCEGWPFSSSDRCRTPGASAASAASAASSLLRRPRPRAVYF